MEYLLDTDTISEFLKRKNQAVRARFSVALQRQESIAFSIISYYEILRGLLFRDAHAQMGRFQTFCSNFQIIDLSRDIVNRAAGIWSDRVKQFGGKPQDSDTLIAATALETNKILVTRNVRHFSWIQGLQIDDWCTH